MTPCSSPPACSVRSYSGEYAVHAHDHAQVVYAVAGRMEMEVDGRGLWVDRASGIVVPAGVRHGFFAPPGALFCVIDLPSAAGTERLRRFAVPERARAWIDAAGVLAPLPASAPQAAHDAAGLAPPAPGWPSGVARAWLAPTPALAPQLDGLLHAPRVLARRAVPAERVEQAVRGALHEAWPTARLAALCHLSVPRFHTRWIELTGATPQAWLRGVRLDAAMRSLAGGQPLEQVALACGYATASALASALRRERGVGARQLRRR